MRLEATIERNRIPEGCVPLPGDYKLASTGQTVVVYRRPEPSPEMVRVQAELERTNEECEVLSRSLGVGDVEEERRLVQELIKRLHEYNEAKDLAQALLGVLAVQEGCTTKELYPRFDLDLDD